MSDNVELMTPDAVVRGLADLPHGLHPEEPPMFPMRLSRAATRVGALYSGALATYHGYVSGVIGVPPLAHAPELFAQDRIPAMAFIGATAICTVIGLWAHQLSLEIADAEHNGQSKVAWPADVEDFESGSTALRRVQARVLEESVEQYAA
jgi:hypothetical protein